MDTQRLILFVVFSFSILLLWESWQKEHTPAPPAPATTTPTAQSTVPTPSEEFAKTDGTSAVSTASLSLAKGERFKVTTDLMEAEIDANGGDLRRLVLLKHGAGDNKSKPLVLMADEAPHYYVAQSGLIGGDLPTHRSVFTSAHQAYSLAAGENALQVELSWHDAAGLQVEKIYTFHRATYVIDVAYRLRNGSTQAIQPSAYFQFVRDNTAPAGEARFVSTYTGPALYTAANKFQKESFSDIAKGKAKSVTAKDGWIAMLQHYFLAAFLPPSGSQREFYTKALGDGLFAAGVILPMGTVAPGTTANISVPLYAGPQEQDTLKNLAPGLGLSVDYGVLTVIATPIFWLLNELHKFVGNWGWAIILLTVLMKLAFYPLSATSYRSMAKMKAVAPRLQKLKESYGDDRQKLHQAMMELYKTEKINPMGGCLPMVIQIPVFIALYWVLLYSVEMRHAPFILWIQDLTAPDPYYVLPVIMGISMIVQTKLNPTPPDPIQAKVMLIMPVAFSVMFFFFPSGLVLYWVVSNLLSIAQQLRINSVLGRNAKPRKA
jgi:YidC/Oxa1 family membrane protein insertase